MGIKDEYNKELGKLTAGDLGAVAGRALRQVDPEKVAGELVKHIAPVIKAKLENSNDVKGRAKGR